MKSVSIEDQGSKLIISLKQPIRVHVSKVTIQCPVDPNYPMDKAWPVVTSYAGEETAERIVFYDPYEDDAGGGSRYRRSAAILEKAIERLKNTEKE